jgi:hypothetical protein
MAMEVWKNPQNEERFLYHHTLIKLIVMDKLEKKNQTLEDFL